MITTPDRTRTVTRALTSRSSTLRRAATWLLTGAVAASVLTACGGESGAAGRGGSSGPQRDAVADDPIAFGQLPDFSLVDSTGTEVTRDDLLGEPFALACIFTTCSGPCPRISEAMAELAGELEDTGVRLVSLSVDPTRDTPQVLATYAESYEADPERWLFLTGEQAESDRLVRGSFFLPLQSDEPSEDVPLGIHVTHSTEMVVFDRAGKIRGYYSGMKPKGLADMQRRLRFLDAEPESEEVQTP